MDEREGGRDDANDEGEGEIESCQRGQCHSENEEGEGLHELVALGVEAVDRAEDIGDDERQDCGNDGEDDKGGEESLSMGIS
jgi:hypothetical protein